MTLLLHTTVAILLVHCGVALSCCILLSVSRLMCRKTAMQLHTFRLTSSHLLPIGQLQAALRAVRESHRVSLSRRMHAAGMGTCLAAKLLSHHIDPLPPCQEYAPCKR
jgi:hypothetical protein